MPPTLAGSVQNRLAVGDDLEGEAERIKDLSQRQFHVAQKRIIDRRRFFFQSLGHRGFSFIAGYRWRQQLSEERWIAAERAGRGEIDQFVHG
jgi:hypothetical protein